MSKGFRVWELQHARSPGFNAYHDQIRERLERRRKEEGEEVGKGQLFK